MAKIKIPKSIEIYHPDRPHCPPWTWEPYDPVGVTELDDAYWIYYLELPLCDRNMWYKLWKRKSK